MQLLKCTSAGTFNTPQLLKLSGIGPSDELAKHKIPLLVNSPGVGKNLQDRYEAPVLARADTKACGAVYSSAQCPELTIHLKHS